MFILFYRHQIKQVMQLQQKLRMMLKLTTELTTAISILTLTSSEEPYCFFATRSCQTVVKVHLHNILFCHPLFADWTSATQKNNSRLNKVCSYSMCLSFYKSVVKFGGQLWMLPTLKFMLSILSNDQPIVNPASARPLTHVLNNNLFTRGKSMRVLWGFITGGVPESVIIIK